MDIVTVTPRVWMLRFEIVNSYVIRTDRGVALIDAGPPGVADAVLAAVARIGAEPADVHTLVLTHAHKDHVGSAADLRTATGARVLASEADAPATEGRVEAAEPVITPEERPYYAQVASVVPDAPPVTVDLVLRDGDRLPWDDPVAVVIAAPGHTEGSVALHLPGERLVVTGDTIASLDGRPILGPFNVDRSESIASFRRLAALDVDVACFGHGDPVLTDARAVLTRTVERL